MNNDYKFYYYCEFCKKIKIIIISSFFYIYIAKLIGVTDAKLGNKCESVRKSELFKLFDNEIFV